MNALCLPALFNDIGRVNTPSCSRRNALSPAGDRRSFLSKLDETGETKDVLAVSQFDDFLETPLA